MMTKHMTVSRMVQDMRNAKWTQDEIKWATRNMLAELQPYITADREYKLKIRTQKTRRRAEVEPGEFDELTFWKITMSVSWEGEDEADAMDEA